MKLEDPGPTLCRLHEAADQISANLVELEIDSSRQLLQVSTLGGQSAAQWSQASGALTELWRRKGLLDGLLEQADKLRGPRRTQQLRALLSDPCIEVASADVPLAERSLLGGPQMTQRCSADELLTGMSALFDQVKSVISRIGTAWETLVPKLDAARRLLQETRRLAEELDESSDRELASVSAKLDELSTCVTTDPLSARATDVDAVLGELTSLRADLEAGAALQRGFEARILGARELLEQIRATVAEELTAREELVLKIVTQAPPQATGSCRGLESELTAISNRTQSGRWREAGHELESWTQRANAQLHDAERARNANRAPIEARNQFRVLLEAYQVKAKRLGRLEDPELSQLLNRARDTLYTAPTDLGTAAQLVRSYQQALSRPAPNPAPVTNPAPAPSQEPAPSPEAIR